jgi:hypothetical protein
MKEKGRWSQVSYDENVCCCSKICRQNGKRTTSGPVAGAQQVRAVKIDGSEAETVRLLENATTEAVSITRDGKRTLEKSCWTPETRWISSLLGLIV